MNTSIFDLLGGPKPTESSVPVVQPANTGRTTGTVVHCKRDRYDVPIDRTTCWGNPFRIGPDGDRDEVIRKYRDWIVQQPELLARLPELRGKVLGCWCHPKPCHGHFLAELANGMPPEAILELWQERTAIMASENPDSNTNVPPIPDDADWPRRQRYEQLVRRFWDIVASAEMSLTYGDYAGWIIRPHLTPAAEDADTIKGGEPMRQHRPA